MYDMALIHRTVAWQYSIVTTCGNKDRVTTFQILCPATIHYTCHPVTSRVCKKLYVTLAITLRHGYERNYTFNSVKVRYTCDHTAPRV